MNDGRDALARVAANTSSLALALLYAATAGRQKASVPPPGQRKVERCGRVYEIQEDGSQRRVS